MKKFLFFINILLCLVFNISSIFAKELKTSMGTFPVKLYNVALVGNSHASYMGKLLGIDSDLNCLIIGNHSVGGDDIPNWGIPNDGITYNNKLIARKGDCKGWINEFITDSPKVEVAICWFGSNSINRNINTFETEYRNWINAVRAKSNCKLILMAIPYNRFNPQKDYQTNANIDKFNAVIKKLANEFKDKNVYYESIPTNYTFMNSDRAHLSKETYQTIWNNCKSKYNIPAIKEVSNEVTAFNGTMKNGWVQDGVGNSWCYYINGTKIKNQWVDWNGNWYWMLSDGRMATDQWVTWNGSAYYLNKDGIWEENKKRTDNKKENTGKDEPNTDMPDKDELYELLLEKVSDNKFNGNIYTQATSVKSFADISKQKWADYIEEDYWGYTSTKITSPTLFRWNNYQYLVLKSDSNKLSYTDDNDKVKTTNYYGISEEDYVSDEVVLLKNNSDYEAYYFNEDGIKSNAIKNTKGTIVKFTKDGKVKSGLTKTSDKDDEDSSDGDFGDLKVYTSDDFGSKLGFFETNNYLRNGYWILEKSGKYTLYSSNSSGKASAKKSNLTSEKLEEYLDGKDYSPAEEYEDDEEELDIDLPTYTKSDFKNGAAGKFTDGGYLANGYWIYDYENDTYSLYSANAKGTSTVKKQKLSMEKINKYLNGLKKVNAAEKIGGQSEEEKKKEEQRKQLQSQIDEYKRKIEELEKELAGL